MSFSLSNVDPAVLIINNIPIIFVDGVSLAKISELSVGKGEDKRAFAWSPDHLFGYSAPTLGEQEGLLGNPTLNEVFVRPVFEGLDMTVTMTPSAYSRLMPVLKPIIQFLYRWGPQATQLTSFFSPLFYILDGYMESSSIVQDKTAESVEWNLVIKSKARLSQDFFSKKNPGSPLAVGNNNLHKRKPFHPPLSWIYLR